MSTPVCYLNGQWLILNEASVAVNDLGLQRGYGIFDFMRVSNGVPLFWEDHLDRFFHSAAQMFLPLPHTREELKAVISELLQKNNLPFSGIKITVTGGPSADGYSIGKPNFLMVQQPITPPVDEMLEPGYSLFTAEHRRQLPEVKTTDYLMAIRLQPWLKEMGGNDILYQQNGIVSECPRSNFFIVNESGTIITPGQHILKGITRLHLLKLARANGIQVEERDVSLTEVFSAREAFISSSTKRLIPVNAIDNHRLPPLSEESITRKLYRLFLSYEKEILKQIH